MGNCIVCGSQLHDARARRCHIHSYLWHLGHSKEMYDISGLPVKWCNTCKKETVQLPTHGPRNRRKTACLDCAAEDWIGLCRAARKRYLGIVSKTGRNCLVCGKPLIAKRNRKWYCGDKCRARAKSLHIKTPTFDHEDAMKARRGKKSMSIYQLTQQSGNKLHKLLDDILDGKTTLVRHG